VSKRGIADLLTPGGPHPNVGMTCRAPLDPHIACEVEDLGGHHFTRLHLNCWMFKDRGGSQRDSAKGSVDRGYSSCIKCEGVVTLRGRNSRSEDDLISHSPPDGIVLKGNVRRSGWDITDCPAPGKLWGARDIERASADYPYPYIRRNHIHTAADKATVVYLGKMKAMDDTRAPGPHDKLAADYDIARTSKGDVSSRMEDELTFSFDDDSTDVGIYIQNNSLGYNS
jgi:hypothetical protein